MVNSIIDKFIQQKLLTRIFSAIILAPVIVYLVYKGKVYFNVMVVLIGLIAEIEWMNIVDNSYRPYRKLWYLSGVLYVMTLVFSLIYLRQLDQGLQIILWLMITIWASDIGAFLFGIAFSGPKFVPKISPSKTWSGCVGGIICSCISGILMIKYYNLTVSMPLLKCACISIFAQLGDLGESMFKRYFGVKDSGNIIPGHGGVLDRVDSVIAGAGFIALYYLLFKSL